MLLYLILVRELSTKYGVLPKRLTKNLTKFSLNVLSKEIFQSFCCLVSTIVATFKELPK